MSRPMIIGRAGSLVLSAALLAGLFMVAVPRAQQAPAAQTPAPAQPAAGQKPDPATAKPAEPAAPAAKPLVPVVASTLAAKPDAFYGESVTVMATVDKTLSPTAFSLDQDRTASDGKDVLVLAPRLNEPVELNTYVTVIGEVVKFDPADAKVKTLLTGLPPDAAAAFTGRPAIIATSVINTAMNDLARRLAPAMTAEEEAFQKVMQTVGAANGAFRTILEKTDAAGAKEQATALKAAFKSTEAFFNKYDKADAVGWAREAGKITEGLETAAAAGKWDEVKASTGSLGKTCQACHGAYRERYDDGAFRAKVGPNWAKPGL